MNRIKRIGYARIAVALIFAFFSVHSTRNLNFLADVQILLLLLLISTALRFIYHHTIAASGMSLKIRWTDLLTDRVLVLFSSAVFAAKEVIDVQMVCAVILSELFICVLYFAADRKNVLLSKNYLWRISIGLRLWGSCFIFFAYAILLYLPDHMERVWMVSVVALFSIADPLGKAITGSAFVLNLLFCCMNLKMVRQ